MNNLLAFLFLLCLLQLGYFQDHPEVLNLDNEVSNKDKDEGFNKDDKDDEEYHFEKSLSTRGGFRVLKGGTRGRGRLLVGGRGGCIGGGRDCRR